MVPRRASGDGAVPPAHLVVDGSGDGGRVLNFDAVVRAFPDTPIAAESLGIALLYSSGTTGRPKGILRPLPGNPPARHCRYSIS